MVDSETTDFYVLLSKLRDYHNAAAEALDAYIQVQSKAVLKEYDPEKIIWINSKGPSGDYLLTNDTDNPDYKALHKDLAEHNGKMTFKGNFYWVFPNGVSVGRKKLSK